MKKILFSLIAAGTLLTVQAEPEVKGTPEDLKKFLNGVSADTSIRVSSKQTVKSDEAVLSFVVTSSDDTLKEAIEDNRQILAKVTAEIIRSGIARANISSKAFSSLPGYSFYSKKPTSYTTKKTVSVKLQSEDELIKVLGALNTYDDQTRFLNMTFNFTDKEKVERELLNENLKKIANKKAVFEKALGVKLRVKTFHEGKTQNDFPQQLNQQALQGYLSSGLRNLKSDGIQWQASDQNQKGFSEFVIERELQIVYTVED